MPLLSSLLTLATVFSLWGLFCFGVYSGLRTIGKSDSGMIVVFGYLALTILLIIFAGIALLAGMSWEGEKVIYPTGYILGIAAALIFTLLVGGITIRVASQGQIHWWQGIQYCALFLVVSHGLVIWLLCKRDDILPAIERAVNRLEFESFNGLIFVAYCFFLWIFPLSAPILEMMLRSFRRAWHQNRTGTYIR